MRRPWMPMSSTGWLTSAAGAGGGDPAGPAVLAGGRGADRVPGRRASAGPFVDDLFARAEGNPFFTEQLAASALLGPGGFAAPAGLPAGLAESLAVRAGRCGADARAALAALAV